MNTETSEFPEANETRPTPDSNAISRRQFMAASSGAATAAFTIVPRHVLGGTGYVAPSEKITDSVKPRMLMKLESAADCSS